MSEDPTPGSLLQNLLLFGRLLRSLGLSVDTQQLIDAVASLQAVGIRSREDFYFALRSLFVHRREDLASFDQAFQAFWALPSDGRYGLRVRGSGSLRRARPAYIPADLLSLNYRRKPQGGEGASEEPPLVQTTFTYSDREALRRKDFAQLDAEEMEAIKRLLSAFTWQFQRPSRRFKPGSSGRYDLRWTYRRNLRFGGELIEWAYRGPKIKSRPLVILADISGSMERYTRILLYFAHSVGSKIKRGGETFVFSTRLTRITRLLKQRNIDQALGHIAQSVPDWSGGTRIDEALKTFNCDWGRRVLGSGAVVLLISDGWDRGDAAVLREEMARLQRSCSRLIWLNPLLGSKDYEPLTRGMQTALPYIDDFLPVHNLTSLLDLATHLEKLDAHPPVRRRDTRPQSEMLVEEVIE